MSSVNDWAAKCAREIVDDLPHRKQPRTERIAAIIVLHAQPLLDLLTERAHYHCEDSFYCCPRCDHPDHGSSGKIVSRCNCGADEFNKKLRAALEGP